MSSYWRTQAAKVIVPIAISYQPGTESELRKQISAAYPFSHRGNWPYKAWLKEVDKQVEQWCQWHGITYSKAKPAKQVESCGGLFGGTE